MKAQSIRLIDVFALGPFMIWFGATAKGVPDAARFAMVAAGAATIGYNGMNYLRARNVE